MRYARPIAGRLSPSAKGSPIVGPVVYLISDIGAAEISNPNEKVCGVPAALRELFAKARFVVRLW